MIFFVYSASYEVTCYSLYLLCILNPLSFLYILSDTRLMFSIYLFDLIHLSFIRSLGMYFFSTLI